MKKLLLFLAVTGLFTIHKSDLHAQLLKPFPDSTGAWRIRYGCINSSPPQLFTGSFRYYINGDTVINSLRYSKLYKGSNNLHDSTNSNFNHITGFFRLDSNIVYYLNLNALSLECGFVSMDEVKLYDFNLNVGDSIINFNNGADSCYLKVNLIDTIIINGESLRQWHFNSYCQNNYGDEFLYTWIEGIGSRLGFFTYFCFFECGQSLGCFNANNQDYIINLGSAASCETLNINDNQDDNMFKVYPNPFSSSTQITFNQTFRNISLETYNLHGQLVYKNQYTFCKQIQFDRAKLQCGIYFLKLKADDTIVKTMQVVILD